ncbi:YtxH domain-containing protein [Bacillus thermotolerans]|uniref:YtxH domain-containing protein n=1 Tax=Bacillus thermotolerans TaxID=1221996 RepID=UPI00057F7028|nr:YtxH domain-containing protein [Bacillus thermotolerans]KKB33350.1 hypothetical protein QY97_03514 [Bacillus thermotolerans]
MEKTKTEEQQSQETKSESTGSPLRRSIAGGLIGAAVGYLADPENGKKLVGSMQPGKLKDAGTGLGQTVKDKTKKAAGSVKGSVGQLFSKQESVPEKGYSNEQGETDENETSLKTDLNNHSAEEGNDSSKTEDQLLNDRLEQMLTKIIDERLGQRKETASDNDKSEPSNESASSQQQAEQDSENKKEAQPSAENEDNEESASYVKQDSLNEKDKQEDQEEKTSKNEKQEEAKETKNNSDYESLKEENEHLQQRLGKIEGLLTKLLQEGNSSQQSSNAKKDEKDSQNKQEEKQADSKEKTEENKQEDEEKKAEEKNKSEENEQEKKQQKEKNGAADESKKNNSSEKEASVSSEKIKEAYNVLSDENADTYLLANGSKKER